MNNWFNILKESKTITDTGITFTLPEEEESKDKRDCCEEAKKVFMESYEQYWSKSGTDFTGEGKAIFGDFFEIIGCDEYKEQLVSYRETWSGPLQDAYPYYNKALDFWEECENE